MELNVFQKILEVKKSIGNFKKDAETSGKGAYAYVSGSQILSLIKAKMEEVGLVFIPVETQSRGWTTYNYTVSNGAEKTDFIVEGKLIYEWVNVDNPDDRQRVSFEYYGQQNDISKAFGSALTYSERYLLLKSLGIPTDEDDPDVLTEDKNYYKQPSKYNQLKDLIKDSDITFEQVNEWIVKSFKKEIKINDLSDEQFSSLVNALRRKLYG